MKRKKEIIIGIIVLILIIGVMFLINKNSPAGNTTNKTQISETVKNRNEALRYISEAHRKASIGDEEGAKAECAKAKKVSPNEPAVIACNGSINVVLKKKR